MSQRSFMLLSICTFVAFITLCALGTWQVQRLQWKEELIRKVSDQTKAEPQPFLDVLGQIENPDDQYGNEYTPVTVSGTFDHSKEIHLQATHDGASGWFIYTPFILENNKIVFVNRGFVPYALKEQEARMDGLPDGSVLLRGLYRETLPEKPNMFIPDNDTEANIFFWKDLKAMAETTGFDQNTIIPAFIDAQGGDKSTFPISNVTLISFPNNHLQYVITWYGLALTLVGVYIALLLQRRCVRHDQPE